MSFPNLDLFLWAACFIGEIILTAVLAARGRARQFPIFTALIGFNLVQDVVAFHVYRLANGHTYFLVFWSMAVVDIALQFGVVYEIARTVFGQRAFGSVYLRRPVFFFTLLAIVMAGFLSWYASPPTGDFTEAIVIRARLFIAVVLMEMFLTTAVFSSRGLKWRYHAFRIIYGLSLYNFVEVLVQAQQSYLGNPGSSYLDLERLRVVMYLCCLIFWIAYLWKDEPELPPFTEEMWQEFQKVYNAFLSEMEFLRSIMNAPRRRNKQQRINAPTKES